jgi:ABC-2 type transport system permease protein
VQGWVPEGVRDALAGISVLSHFESISRGVIDLRDIIYFMALIAAMLVANTLLIDWRKAA